ncbi:uncharacterized protein LOC129593197 isoform X2 [Paramacrobiotus metropolitanus]|uniref:uncharacterized protein LOC129593197 isoform X2 n=1 Tax=Paramacrobiotus metropolitanus TaxID=2943436 RepID=UPI00244630E6|nr:uncharacterized protein LOC129593197 isoform X2 [Paramacrobiotus metropolitanus]
MHLLRLFCLLSLTNGHPAQNGHHSLITDNRPHLLQADEPELYAMAGTRKTEVNCEIDDSSNSTSVTWFRNGSEIIPYGDPDNRRFVTKKAGFVLVLHNLTLSDHNSVIGCRLTNAHGTTWHNVTLIVISEAKIPGHPRMPSIFEDDNVEQAKQDEPQAPYFFMHSGTKTLEFKMTKLVGASGLLGCLAVGYPQSLVVWTKDGAVVHNSDFRVSRRLLPADRRSASERQRALPMHCHKYLRISSGEIRSCCRRH